MKPQCQHIGKAYGNLGVYEYTPAVAASVVSLELVVLVNHQTHDEATLSSNKRAY